MLREWAMRHGIPDAAMVELRSMFTPGAKSNDEGSESRIQSLTRLAAAERRDGCILLRNNSGATTDETGRVVRYGLGNDSAQVNAKYKSPDLVGVTPIVINGRTLGIATFMEVKKPGWTKPTNDREHAQMAFLVDMAARGAIAGFVANPDDYKQYIENYCATLTKR